MMNHFGYSWFHPWTFWKILPCSGFVSYPAVALWTCQLPYYSWFHPWIFWTILPCSGFVNYPAVALWTCQLQYLTLILSLMNKYLTLMCLVHLLLIILPFFVRRIVLILSWYIVVLLDWYLCASKSICFIGSLIACSLGQKAPPLLSSMCFIFLLWCSI